MVYRNNFIVVIKHNGRILRDVNEVVTLPFGAEYSILLKNKYVTKAVASVEVDGVDALNGSEIIVPANDSVELKGFMRGKKVRNKFKFIKKTKEISNFRGDRPDDGLVRVEYRFEKAPDPVQVVYTSNVLVDPYWYDGRRGIDNTKSSNFCCDIQIGVSAGDDGITVPGSVTNQDFAEGSVGTLESSSNVIILKLQGRTKISGKLVKKPITVKTKLQCPTCGKKWRSSNTFCGRCGTFLC